MLERESQIESLNKADLKRLAHELAVHQVELEIQNEELRQTRVKAEEARDRYLDLFDFAPVGYFTLDEHNRIVEANLTGCQLLKMDRSKLLKQSFTKFIHAEESEKFYLQRQRVLESGTRNTFELQLLKADGTSFYAQIESLKVGEEKLRLAVMDITELKKAEQLKDEFIGLVSHELKTPLTVIMGALSTATDERVSQEESRELIRNAVVHSEILASIIDNLLELSRQQSGRLSLQVQPVNVGEIAQNVIGKLQNKSAIHRLVSDFPLGLPPSLADSLRVERILYNLVDNAIKYSPKGGEVKVSSRQDGDFLLVGVRDNGPGISRGDQARLFQSFERLGTKANGIIQGTGLGLEGVPNPGRGSRRKDLGTV